MIEFEQEILEDLSPIENVSLDIEVGFFLN